MCPRFAFICECLLLKQIYLKQSWKGIRSIPFCKGSKEKNTENGSLLWCRVPHLFIHPKKVNSLVQRHNCTFSFVVALFTILRIWKQHRWLWTGEWINKIYMYTMLYHNEERNHDICSKKEGGTRRQLSEIMLSEKSPL